MLNMLGMIPIFAEIKRRWPYFLAMGAAAFFLGGAMWEGGLFGEVMAAWVQAIGSIAAICIAIWIDQSATRRAERAKHETAADLAFARREALLGAANRLDRLQRELAALFPDTVSYTLGELEYDMARRVRLDLELADRILKRFLEGELGKPALMGAMLVARTQLTAIIDSLDVRGGKPVLTE